MRTVLRTGSERDTGSRKTARQICPKTFDFLPRKGAASITISHFFTLIPCIMRLPKWPSRRTADVQGVIEEGQLTGTPVIKGLESPKTVQRQIKTAEMFR